MTELATRPSAPSGGWRTGFNLGSNQCNCPLDEREYVLQFVNNWAKISGNHTFKWGADVRRGQEVITCDNCNRILYYAPEKKAQPVGV